MTPKQEEKLLKVIVETVETSLKPSIKDIHEELNISADQLEEIKAQLNRIEHKIDLLLASQTQGNIWPLPKKKIFKS